MRTNREDIEQRFNDLLPALQHEMDVPDIDVVDSVMERIATLPSPKAMQRKRLHRQIGFSTSIVTLAAAACVAGILFFNTPTVNAQAIAPSTLNERLEDAYNYYYDLSENIEDLQEPDNPLTLLY